MSTLTPLPGYTIRPMAQPDLELALQWAADEGWNPGQHDAEAFFAADPQGHLMGWLNGTPMASLSVVAYGASYAFLGLYIVRPEYRGQGYGLALWQAGMAQLKGRAVGLDGVVAQQPNYRRSGFCLAHRNLRYEFQATPAHHNALPALLQRLPNTRIQPASTLPAPDILAFDQAFFPDNRQAFLDSWLRLAGDSALALIENEQLAGYGVIRACRQGFKIGPLFANTQAQAEALLLALLAPVPLGSSVYLDIPETNPHAITLAERHGMKPMFETARMYRGSPRLPDMQRTYGITTFELG